MAHNQPSEYPSQGSDHENGSSLDPEVGERLPGRKGLNKREKLLTALTAMCFLSQGERERK